MGVKKMVAAVVASMALTAVVANAAHAAWFIEGKELGAALQEDVKYAAMTPFTLSGNPIGAVKITAQKVECAAGATCSIDGANFGTDHSTAKLTFTEVTVDEPANCSVAGGAFTTTALTDEVIMDPKGGLSTFDKFFPEVPTTIAEIEFVGALCPIAGVVAPLKGTITAEMQRTTTAIALQALDFGAAEQATGEGKLTWGKPEATLAGEATMSLSGGNVGKIFSATE